MGKGELKWEGEKNRGVGTVGRSLCHAFSVIFKWNLFVLKFDMPENPL